MKSTYLFNLQYDYLSYHPNLPNSHMDGIFRKINSSLNQNIKITNFMNNQKNPIIGKQDIPGGDYIEIKFIRTNFYLNYENKYKNNIET